MDDDFEDQVDEEEEENVSQTPTAFKDALIFLIDCNESMFQERAEYGGNTFSFIIRHLANIMKDKIISNATDFVGVCFFSTREKSNPNDFSHVFVFQDLDQPAARRIRQLEELASKPELFHASIGASPSISDLREALWICSNMFSQSCTGAGKHFLQRVFLFTNVDDPSQGDITTRTRILQKAKDLEEMDVMLELFSFQPPNAVAFDPKRFYLDMIPVEEDEVEQRLSPDRIKDLSDTLRRKAFKKRALMSTTLSIADDTQIAVQVFSLLNTATKGSGTWLDKRTNAPLKCDTRWVCKSTGKLLEDYEIKTYHPYGGEHVFFDKSETKEIKQCGPPGLVLMGFKPVARLKIYHNVRSSHFIYPDENRVKGSTVACHALLKAMKNLGMWALARFVGRGVSIPRFVALLPQEEVNDERGYQPPGFNMVYLPYADDVRKPKVEPTPIADASVVEAAKQVINQLHIIDFDCRNFSNPVLQRHYGVLQALALDEKFDDSSVVDVCQPDEHGFRQAAPLLDAWQGLVQAAASDLPASDVKPAAKRATKRKSADDDDGEPSSKKPRSRKAAPAVPDDGSIDLDQWKQKLDSDMLKKETVVNLKEFCRAVGLPVSGTKPVLLERITDFLSK